MYRFIRSLLFQLDPETAHHVAMQLLTWIPKFFFQPIEAKASITAMGLNFSHPIGLAAGFDKNGQYLNGLNKLGFSFIEVGTVTKQAQIGNPKPRLFRIPKAHALINRMGFNNEGVEGLLNNLESNAYRGILGINIGKNKDTPITEAVQEYLYCFERVHPYASYVTVNVSSPNTPGLRELQQADYFQDLVTQLKQKQRIMAEAGKHYVPLVIKLSPDESDETIKRMANIAVSNSIDGLIATNTTRDRSRVEGLLHASEAGGLSGRPLVDASMRCLQLLKQEVGDSLTLIAAGGIDSPAIASAKLAAGADLLQIYTGLIYQGPALINQLAASCKLKYNSPG